MKKALVFLLLFAGCTPCRQCVDPTPELTDQSGYSVVWNRTIEEADSIEEPLTLSQAIQFALLHNRQLQALFEEMGVAKGEYTNAVLLSNPALDIAFRYPNTSGLNLDLEGAVVGPFMELLTYGKRKRLADWELQIRKQEISSQVMSFIEEVALSYFNLYALENKRAIQKEIVDLAELRRDIALEQQAAGAVGQQLPILFHTSAKQEGLQYKELDEQTFQAKADLGTLLGTTQPFQIVLTLPQEKLPNTEQDYWMQRAWKERYDVQTLCSQIQKELTRKGLLEPWIYTQLWAGAAAEREPEGDWIRGPALSLAIPIFNFGQGDRTIQAASLWKTYQMLLHLKIEIEQNIYKLLGQLSDSFSIIEEIENQILPSNAQSQEQALRLYNVMNANVYDLLDRKREEFDIQMNLVDVRTFFWSSKARLLRAAGGAI